MCFCGGLQYVDLALDAEALWILGFSLQIARNEEPTSGLEPLTCSSYE